MTQNQERLVYRPCPCFANDIEGIQTWLEDLACEGLSLEPDGRALSIFTFRQTAPQTVRYRLEASSARGIFAVADGPDAEMRAFCAQMGWEYLVNFGHFHIYRCADPQAQELNTDPAIQAATLNRLKKEQRSAAFYAVLYPLAYSFLSNQAISPLRLGVMAGLWLPGSILAWLLWALLSSVLTVIRLGRYQKRLRGGEALTARKEWKSTAHLAKWARLLPGTLLLILVISLGSLALKTEDRQPLENAPTDLPFVTLDTLFPEAQLNRDMGFGDYNTFLLYETALSTNYGWNEWAYVTREDGTYNCLIRVEFHDTAASWLAKHTAMDHYRYEQRRYNGKRFEAEVAPETAFDTLYLFRSYGILHIVGQEGKQIFHATVQFSDPNDEPCWELWLRAMEEKLCQ